MVLSCPCRGNLVWFFFPKKKQKSKEKQTKKNRGQNVVFHACWVISLYLFVDCEAGKACAFMLVWR